MLSYALKKKKVHVSVLTENSAFYVVWRRDWNLAGKAALGSGIYLLPSQCKSTYMRPNCKLLKNLSPYVLSRDLLEFGH